MHRETIGTPLGKMTALADEQGLQLLEFAERPDLEARLERYAGTADFVRRPHPVIDQTRRELVEYFQRTRETFGIPLSPRGTQFQRQVWEALTEIPYGVTRTYAQQAARIDRPKAVRAVGAANGQNPIAIVVPCHRVVGANGHLTGYGGGLERKKKLLAHEGATLF